jgi:peptide/nickel transport system permease protein
MQRTGTALKRTAIQALPTMLGIVVLCFLLLQLVPGNAADVLVAESGSATAETMNAMRVRFGLDQTMMQQLLHYLVHLIHFDLGYSARFGMPVARLIGERLPNTLLLMVRGWAWRWWQASGRDGSWRFSPDAGRIEFCRLSCCCFTRRRASGLG